jgi:trigger factor
MSTDTEATERTDESPATGSGEKQPQLTLQVTVTKPTACERHVTIVLPREDIDRYIEREYDELMPKAAVPGFRPGRAPRKLVVNRFKDQIGEQVKSKVVVDAMTQALEEQKFSAISEPDLKLDAIQMPDTGPLTFEFTIEVRPEFDLPEWKGLTLEKPIWEISDEDVERHLKRLLARHGRLVDRDGPAEEEDHVTLNMTFRYEGQVISTVEDRTLALKPKLSFRDAQLEGFAGLLKGARPGEHRQAQLRISEDAESEALRGKDVDAEMQVLKVQKLEPPKLTPQFLEHIGGFSDEADLRDTVREELKRQQRFRQQQHVRQQITRQLTRTANWELPPALLRKQTRREVQRMVLELQSAGFSNELIQAYSNTLHRNSLAYTETALKEHFILERLAEEQSIEATAKDFDDEIELIAEQNMIPPRRVRARLEKRGEMDALRNQIVERKVIELITSHALVTEKPFRPEAEDEVVAVAHAVSGATEQAVIPEAKHSDVAKPLPGHPERA